MISPCTQKYHDCPERPAHMAPGPWKVHLIICSFQFNFIYIMITISSNLRPSPNPNSKMQPPTPQPAPRTPKFKHQTKHTHIVEYASPTSKVKTPNPACPYGTPPDFRVIMHRTSSIRDSVPRPLGRTLTYARKERRTIQDARYYDGDDAGYKTDLYAMQACNVKHSCWEQDSKKETPQNGPKVKTRQNTETRETVNPKHQSQREIYDNIVIDI
ncbi:hypothetical protein EDC01DRAFT_212169 [Geopyxis carbonaria]|nr:hypothetical protein EDC01DRAFT_212169 [Geopyxis carbonaria]